MKKRMSCLVLAIGTAGIALADFSYTTKSTFANISGSMVNKHQISGSKVKLDRDNRVVIADSAAQKIAVLNKRSGSRQVIAWSPA